MDTTDKEFKVGDKVKWNDPAINDVPAAEREEYKNTIYTICDIHEDDVIDITTDGICVTEVYANEIYKV